MACNFYDSDSEASHLAEIEDEDYLCEVNSYILNFGQPQVTKIKKKNHLFTKDDLGKFVIIQSSRYGDFRNLYLVDRNKTKDFWWSPNAKFAMKFIKKSCAEYQAKRYKYNNVKVIEITKEILTIKQ